MSKLACITKLTLFFALWGQLAAAPNLWADESSPSEPDLPVAHELAGQPESTSQETIATESQTAEVEEQPTAEAEVAQPAEAEAVASELADESEGQPVAPVAAEEPAALAEAPSVSEETVADSAEATSSSSEEQQEDAEAVDAQAAAEAVVELPSEPRPPQADSIDLKQVVTELETPVHAAVPATETPEPAAAVNPPRVILGVEVPAGTATRLIWTPDDVASGFAERTPVLVVNGRHPGKTLCLTGAVHGDELNGIEMIRRIMYQLDPEKVSGAVIGVPVVNLMGFRRGTRYLPDRRDLNRFFPGNTYGSSASRIAHSFFNNVVKHCDALVDLHTGSFHRTNLTQLRADLSNEAVANLAQSFGQITVLNSRGNPGSLRASAVRAGIPAVTVEAGEPLRLQNDVVAEGAKAIETLLGKMGIYGRVSKWTRQAPVYYKSSWVRADQSGILFSRVPLGKRVVKGEVLGTVTDPITNARSDIVSPFNGRVLGMALDQVVMPGFAAYHIGIQTPEAALIEEAQMSGDYDENTEVPYNLQDLIPEPGTQERSTEILDDEEEED